jgi:hypothetical protein
MAPWIDGARKGMQSTPQICAKGFDPQLGSFVQSYGSKALDASFLLFSQVGFLPDGHPHILGTLKAIERGAGLLEWPRGAPSVSDRR